MEQDTYSEHGGPVNDEHPQGSDTHRARGQPGQECLQLQYKNMQVIRKLSEGQ